MKRDTDGWTCRTFLCCLLLSNNFRTVSIIMCNTAWNIYICISFATNFFIVSLLSIQMWSSIILTQGSPTSPIVVFSWVGWYKSPAEHRGTLFCNCSPTKNYLKKYETMYIVYFFCSTIKSVKIWWSTHLSQGFPRSNQGTLGCTWPPSS